MEYEKTPWGRAIPYTSPTGVETTLYNISTLASAVGRTAQTVRKWEVSGVIPPTPFKVQGKRMYAKEHIDAIVECAESSKLQVAKPIKDTAFSKHVYQRFQEINDMFFKEHTEEVKEESKNGKLKVKKR